MEMAEQERKQKLMFRSIPARCVIENFEKIAKKFKKQNNTIMASFLAKIGWKMYPMSNRKQQKSSKKI